MFHKHQLREEQNQPYKEETNKMYIAPQWVSRVRPDVQMFWAFINSYSLYAGLCRKENTSVS